MTLILNVFTRQNNCFTQNEWCLFKEDNSCYYQLSFNTKDKK